MNGDPAERAPEPGARVRLYVAGASPNSALARANLHAALAEFPDHRVHVEIIDVLLHPDRGLLDGILITPMLIKDAPPPERRILGNLRDRDLLLAVLGIAVSP